MLPTICLVIITSKISVINEINIEMKNGASQPFTIKLFPIKRLANFKIMTFISGYESPSVKIVSGIVSNLIKGFTV